MTALMLRSALFALVCGIVGYMLYVLIMWAIAVCMIGAWVFTLVAGGGASGG
jgi:hypothetical protein